MKRTTVMADEELLEQLRGVARREGVSLAEVIRQGMEWRAAHGRKLRLIGAVSTGRRTAIAEEASDLNPEPQPWR